MRNISAQLIITNTGQALKRAVITAEDDGTIISIRETYGDLKESQSVEFYNGIIIPGFVNCHCHLELSHLKGVIPEGNGLSDFIMKVRSARTIQPDEQKTIILKADSRLSDEGIVLCADICNSKITFEAKKKSRIRYLNLLEIFGIDPVKTGKRIAEIEQTALEAERANLEWALVPHSAYSVSLPLFRLLKEKSGNNRVTSIHFMESEDESRFLEDQSGPLRKSYEASGLLPPLLQMPPDPVSAILGEVTGSGNLILVHNTFAGREMIQKIKKRGNTYWCLCPGSNLFIERKMPPVDILMSESCEIVIGTDSLASNSTLSILSELKLIQSYFPYIETEELIRWATINGAKALGHEDEFGKIATGLKPGLLLLRNMDLVNISFLPETNVVRLL